jgi:hypothetical protein
MGERSAHDLGSLVKKKEEIIESYGRMISEARDNDLKNCFRNIQENHFKQMMIFSDRVIELGREPKFDLGLHGIHEDMHHYDSSEKGDTDIQIARSALESEKLDSEILLSYDLSDEDSKSHDIVKNAVDNDRDNIRALEEYIRHSEIQ